MKILMLHNRYLAPGGEEQSTEAEMALLRDHGHHAELLQRDNREIESLGRAQTARRTIWASDSYRLVVDRLRIERFDILHVQNFFPLWSPSVYYAAARFGVPVVQTLHNYRLMCVNSTFFRQHHPCEDCLGRAAPWPGIVHGCYRNSRAGSAVVAGMIGWHKLVRTWERRVQVYVAVSDFAREKYVAGGWPANRIATRPNFLDPAPTPGNGGGRYALYVGRLSPEKGIATMLDAWTGADRTLPLRLVGDGPLRDWVASRCQAARGLEYLGPRPLEDVLELMRRAEWLVFPSESYETMGRTIMEAFAVGTPVVAARVGSAATMVSSGRTGFHFAAGNVGSLRERIEWCSQHLQEVRALRPNARAAFEKTYTGALAAASLLAIYRTAHDTLAAERPGGVEGLTIPGKPPRN